MEYITYHQEEHIGRLIIDRPKSLNALNSQVIAELSMILKTIGGSDIRCLIITGAGEKSFVAGADIAEMKDLSPEDATAFGQVGNQMMDQIEGLPMPVIAAVNGYALGGGCELALACDIRIAATNAVFALPEASLGIMPGYGGVQRLVRTIGLAKAKELAFTANRINAEEALAIGLVNQVVSQEDLLTTCREMARKIAANAPVSVRMIKQVANQSAEVVKTHGLEVAAFAECFKIEDQYQAMAAFVEKRAAEPFSGKMKGQR